MSIWTNGLLPPSFAPIASGSAQQQVAQCFLRKLEKALHLEQGSLRAVRKETTPEGKREVVIVQDDGSKTTLLELIKTLPAKEQKAAAQEVFEEYKKLLSAGGLPEGEGGVSTSEEGACGETVGGTEDNTSDSWAELMAILVEILGWEFVERWLESWREIWEKIVGVDKESVEDRRRREEIDKRTLKVKRVQDAKLRQKREDELRQEELTHRQAVMMQQVRAAETRIVTLKVPLSGVRDQIVMLQGQMSRMEMAEADQVTGTPLETADGTVDHDSVLPPTDLLMRGKLSATRRQEVAFESAIRDEKARAAAMKGRA